MDAACERVTDLVGPVFQRQGHDDQVAGGALDQGRARTGPIFSDDEVPLPSYHGSSARQCRGTSIDQSHAHNKWCAPACGGLAHPSPGGQAHAMLDQRLLEVGVNPRIESLMADRVAGACSIVCVSVFLFERIDA